jgi:hypothetical protein
MTTVLLKVLRTFLQSTSPTRLVWCDNMAAALRRFCALDSRCHEGAADMLREA